MLRYLTFFLPFFFTFPAFPVGGDQECALKKYYLSNLQGLPRFLCNQAIDSYKEGRQTPENVDQICRGVKNVTWKEGLDNSMSDSNEKPARAMGIISPNLAGPSVGVQVCPGIYLATAHGALDNPQTAKEEGREMRSPKKNLSAIYGFPISKETRMEIKDDKSFVSPMLRNPELWYEPNSRFDYVFIKVENPVSPEDYIKPLSYEKEYLLEASKRGDIDVNMYRPKSSYEIAPNGFPILDSEGKFDEEKTDLSVQGQIKQYDVPQKVNRRCDIFPRRILEGLLMDNCPSESGVSGSPYAVKIENEDYLVGMAVNSPGKGNVITPKDGPPGTTEFLITKELCVDYESVCGNRCENLKDKLSISL